MDHQSHGQGIGRINLAKKWGGKPGKKIPKKFQKIEKKWKGALDSELQEAKVVQRRNSKQGYVEDMGEEALE